MLNEQETKQARQLYCRWFAKFPKMKNPTDINSRSKYDFAVQIGWEKMRLMMTARKANTDKSIQRNVQRNLKLVAKIQNHGTT